MRIEFNSVWSTIGSESMSGLSIAPGYLIGALCEERITPYGSERLDSIW